MCTGLQYKDQQKNQKNDVTLQRTLKKPLHTMRRQMALLSIFSLGKRMGPDPNVS